MTQYPIAIDLQHGMQEQEEHDLSVYVGICVSGERTKRHLLKAQRSLADTAQRTAQEQLGTIPAPSYSRTHCRGIAAAMLSKNIIPLGIDIEYADPRRNWPEILSVFCDNIALSGYSIHALNRGWTYLEAYYKAFAQYPPAKDVIAVIDHQFPDNEIYQNADGYLCLHRSIETVFYMTLIWKPTRENKAMSQPSILPILYSDI
ncbi:hypothetical protein [Hirschia litorea]|uniref:DUF3800 domain-containing protein n=1 Tax=Hirschia litorea TaxID=1199156 RepID=A0ABW2IIL6_9PROT